MSARVGKTKPPYQPHAFWLECISTFHSFIHNGVYQQFTFVSHTIEALLPFVFVLTNNTNFAIGFSGYFVPGAFRPQDYSRRMSG